MSVFNVSHWFRSGESSSSSSSSNTKSNSKGESPKKNNVYGSDDSQPCCNITDCYVSEVTSSAKEGQLIISPKHQQFGEIPQLKQVNELKEIKRNRDINYNYHNNNNNDNDNDNNFNNEYQIEDDDEEEEDNIIDDFASIDENLNLIPAIGTTPPSTRHLISGEIVGQDNNNSGAALLPEQEQDDTQQVSHLSYPCTHTSETQDNITTDHESNATTNDLKDMKNIAKKSATLAKRGIDKNGNSLVKMPDKKRMRLSNDSTVTNISNENNNNVVTSKMKNLKIESPKFDFNKEKKRQEIESTMSNFFKNAQNWTNSFGQSVSTRFALIGTSAASGVAAATAMMKRSESQSPQNSVKIKGPHKDNPKNGENTLSSSSPSSAMNKDNDNDNSNSNNPNNGEMKEEQKGDDAPPPPPPPQPKKDLLGQLTAEFIKIDLGWLNDLLKSENKSNKPVTKIPSSTNGIKNSQTIISEVWSQLTGEKFFQRIFDAKHWRVAQIWSQLCHRIDLAYPDPDTLKPLPIFGKNLEMLSSATYAMRHALCAYPPIFLVYLLGDVRFAVRTAQSVISEAFGIDAKKDIIKCNLNPLNTLHCPSYYLCIDHNRHKIVLVVRGSASISDVLTDANFDSKEFSVFDKNGNEKIGRAHDGMLASARWIYDETKEDLQNICMKYPNYQVVFTGHSLGGGCASLLGLLYKGDEIVYKQNKLHVYSFASPCVVSKNIAETANHYIFSFILGTDIITRLSLQSVLHMYKRFDLIQAILNSEESQKLRAEMNLKNKEKEIAILQKQSTQAKNQMGKQLKEEKRDQMKELIKQEEMQNDQLILTNEKEIEQGSDILSREMKNMDGLKAELDKFRDSQRLISRCLIHLDDELIDNNETHAFLLTLKEMQPVVERDQLYPVGRIMWFVPHMALEKDKIKRKRLLMGMMDNNDKNNKDNVVLKNNSIQSLSSFNLGIDTFKQAFFGSSAVNNSNSNSNNNNNNHNSKTEEKKEERKDGNEKEKKGETEKEEEMEYYSNFIKTNTNLTRIKDYVLCDATEHRMIFQELVVEFYDSFYAHMPTRYMEVFNTTLMLPNDD